MVTDIGKCLCFFLFFYGILNFPYNVNVMFIIVGLSDDSELHVVEVCVLSMT